MTKLAILLSQRGMSQRDLQRAIQSKFGIKYADDRISKIVNGYNKNYSLTTAKILSDTLGVKIDDISEITIKTI